MGFAENIRALSGIECLLGSAVSYSDQIKAGVPSPIASANLFGNISNGLIRNEFAYGMQKYWNNPAGNLINSYYGYGNPQANALASISMMNVCSPWLMFNSGIFWGGMGYYYPPMYCFC